MNIRLATEEDLAAFAARKAADRAALAAMSPREAQKLVGIERPELLRVIDTGTAALRSDLLEEGDDVVE